MFEHTCILTEGGLSVDARGETGKNYVTVIFKRCPTGAQSMSPCSSSARSITAKSNDNQKPRADLSRPSPNLSDPDCATRFLERQVLPLGHLHLRNDFGIDPNGYL